jgi:hypothetical protein
LKGYVEAAKPNWNPRTVQSVQAAIRANPRMWQADKQEKPQ